MAAPDLHEHLFRREAGRLVAAVTRVFGVHNLALAEDVVQDAFCRAAEVWALRGVPENPAAWLTTAAKNRALDVVRRERTARTFAAQLGRQLDADGSAAFNEAFAEHTIRDEQLRMMFSCCHPALAQEAQIALVLNILCGFGAGEIAAALLAGRAAVEKRIARGKQTLASAKRLFDLNDEQCAERLSTVHCALYLLFNEGYHGASSETPVQAQLCDEAIYLTALLRAHPLCDTPTTNALAALMCLHAARIPGRIDAEGDLNTLADQDRTKWDTQLIHQGLVLLERSAAGTAVTAYHLEAAIAAAHVAAPSLEDTNWAAIVELYDRLMAVAPSPVVALNRAIAVAALAGPEAGLRELDAIANKERLQHYPFLPAARGELELRRGARVEACAQFSLALALARSPAEKRLLHKRLAACGL